MSKCLSHVSSHFFTCLPVSSRLFSFLHVCSCFLTSVYISFFFLLLVFPRDIFPQKLSVRAHTNDCSNYLEFSMQVFAQSIDRFSRISCYLLVLLDCFSLSSRPFLYIKYAISLRLPFLCLHPQSLGVVFGCASPPSIIICVK